MPAVPSSAAPAARLAALASPLGGASPLTSPRSGLTPAALPDVNGRAGLSGQSGLPGALVPGTRLAAPPGSGTFTDLLAQQLGLTANRRETLSALLGDGGLSPPGTTSVAGPALAAMSPHLAQAAAAAPRTSRSPAMTSARKVERAIAWARSMLGRQEWNGLCQRFVEEAYGTRGAYPTAAAAARDLVTHRGRNAWHDAPPGALLYFAADASNDFNGHAGIYLGNGKMLSATPAGVREDRLDSPYWSERFIGWGEPARFPGRGGASTTAPQVARPRAPARASQTGAASAVLGAPPVAATTPGLPLPAPMRPAIPAQTRLAGPLPPALPRRRSAPAPPPVQSSTNG